MKRPAKMASLALAAAMVFTMCACSAKPSRSGRIRNDEQSKPERQTGETVETVATPTISATPTNSPVPDPTGAVKGAPVQMTVPDLMYVSELSVGLDPDQAEELLTAVLGITDYAVVDSGSASNGAPQERFLRNLDRDISVEGVIFKSIGIHTNSSGVVVDVDYTIRETAIFDTNEAFDSESYYNTLYPVFCDSYGDPSDDYQSTWVDFDKSGLYGWEDGDYWISLFWGMSCQSVKGNDQLVIGIEHSDRESVRNGGGSTTRPSATTSLEDVYGVMENCIGFDRGMTERYLENLFGIELGEPSDNFGEEKDRTIYTYDVDITMDGFHFNQIEIDVNSNFAVYHIGFINNVDDPDVLHENCLELRDMASDYLDMDPYLDYPLTDDNELLEFYDFQLGDGHVLSVGAYYAVVYNSLWLTYEDSELGI